MPIILFLSIISDFFSKSLKYIGCKYLDLQTLFVKVQHVVQYIRKVLSGHVELFLCSQKKYDRPQLMFKFPQNFVVDVVIV